MLVTTLCYLIQDKHILLLHKNRGVSAGKYLGLGGKAEAGESPRACVIREVQEESGLTISNPKFHGSILFPNFDGQDELVCMYTATYWEGTLQDCEEGSLQWVLQSEVMNLPLWEGDRVFLPWLLEQKYFEAVFHYNDQLEFQKHEVIFFDTSYRE